MNFGVRIDGRTVEYRHYPDDSDSYYSSPVPFVDPRSTRTRPITRYWMYESCYGRREADAGTGDAELKRDSDSREVDDSGVIPEEGEVFTATRTR